MTRAIMNTSATAQVRLLAGRLVQQVRHSNPDGISDSDFHANCYGYRYSDSRSQRNDNCYCDATATATAYPSATSTYTPTGTPIPTARPRSPPPPRPWRSDGLVESGVLRKGAWPRKSTSCYHMPVAFYPAWLSRSFTLNTLVNITTASEKTSTFRVFGSPGFP